MKTMELARQDYRNPDFKVLEANKNQLERWIHSEMNLQDYEWRETIKKIVRFQAEDGSFNLLDSFDIEEDCRIFYCYEPTYICTAILMKAMLLDGDILTGKEDIILTHAMEKCSERRLIGHGFDATRDVIKAVKYFIDCNVTLFIEKYPDLCPEFNEMMKEISADFKNRDTKKLFYGSWGESYEKDILMIADYFSKHTIFVYGTLMAGQTNHKSFLANANYLGDGKLYNYRNFNLGHFPGIVKGDGVVYGELYEVSDSELDAINRLEGEGSLYIKTPVLVHVSEEKTVLAEAYVYNHSVTGFDEVNGKYGKDEYVWYVAYGSNLLEDRMKYYIQGGFCKYNGRTYSACSDTTLPDTSRPIMIPYSMIYSNYNMGSWKNSAVSFLDLSKPGKAYGRAYKIKKSQLSEIHLKEGKNPNWYPECIRLEDVEGLKAYTFGGYIKKRREPFSRVSAEYGYVLYKGMKETYPKMSDDEIYEYLRTGM